MSAPTAGLSRLKRLVPAPLKRKAKTALLNRTFRRAVAQIATLRPGDVPTREVLASLQQGWSNEGFAARIEFLEEVARRAANTAGPILECGSGLTTILMGLLAGRRGVETWSLEHSPDWHARVVQTLDRFDISHVRVCHTVLRDGDGFSWYHAPLTELPQDFQLVICDGPPGDTQGGRYGLFPILGSRLSAGSVILLDDAARPSEVEVLRRWTSEAKLEVSMREFANGSFAVITLH